MPIFSLFFFYDFVFRRLEFPDAVPNNFDLGCIFRSVFFGLVNINLLYKFLNDFSIEFCRSVYFRTSFRNASALAVRSLSVVIVDLSLFIWNLSVRSPHLRSWRSFWQNVHH